MTARILLLAALCAAGCATRSPSVWTNGGAGVPLGGNPASVSPRSAEAPDSAWSVSLAGPDSMTLRFHAPAFGSWDCYPDSAHPLRDYLRVSVLRLKGQAPSWYRGAEADSAAWAAVRRECEPDTVWSAWVAPGARCSVRVGSGEYITPVARQRCGWRVVRVP